MSATISWRAIGPAHLHALRRVAARRLQRGLRDAQALDGHRDPRLVHEGQDVGKPAPRASQQLGAASRRRPARRWRSRGSRTSSPAAPRGSCPCRSRGAAPRRATGRRGPVEPCSLRASTTQTSPQPLVMNCLRPFEPPVVAVGHGARGDGRPRRSRRRARSWPPRPRSRPRPAASPSARSGRACRSAATMTAGPWWNDVQHHRVRAGPRQASP